MKKYAVVAVLALAMGGCGFAQGFRDESARQLAEIAAEEVSDRLGDDFKDVVTGIKGVGDSMPKKDPVNDGLLYTLGGLAAYIVGSFGKGKIREMKSKKSGSSA